MTRILIADDQEDNLSLLRLQLERAGFNVVEARNGSEALALAQACPPDLIISDILMPVIDGFALCRAWRSNPRLARVPFVFYTGTYTDSRDEQFAMDLGANAFIRKPGEREELIGRVREVLQNSSSFPHPCPAPVAGDLLLQEYNAALVRKLEDKLSELEQSNRLLRSTQERLRKQAGLLNLVQDAIIVWASDGKITEWNRGAETLFGWSAGETMGRHAIDLLGNPDDRCAWEEARQVVGNTGEWGGELLHTTKSGKNIIVESHWRLVPESSGAHFSVLVVGADVTEKKRFDEQRLRAQRLESIGTLAGGIAHDLNNILAPTALLLTSVSEQVSDPRVQSLLESVRTSLERGGTMVRQILEFSRGTKPEKTAVQTQNLFEEINGLVARTFPKAIAVETSVGPDLWTIRGSATQLHQLLMNLCVNARDAMRQGGRLVVGAKNLVLTPEQAKTIRDARPGRYVVWSISDTGMGIAPEAVDRIWEPFFTTKPPGEGTGLGLSTVRAIVSDHDGYVTLESQQGAGSTFTVYLPAVDSCPSVPPGEPVKTSRGNGETVLVVDDEELMRDVIGRVLVKHGYWVLTAADGRAALNVFARESSDIDLVLTDLIMPGMDGGAFIKELEALAPRVPIIATTGMPLDSPCQIETPSHIVVLRKPCRAEILLNAVDNALQTSRRENQSATTSPEKNDLRAGI